MMRYARFARALSFACVLQASLAHAATMETEVTLTLGLSGMKSFASYHYTYSAYDPQPTRYDQYHVIVNGNVSSSTSVNTSVWSHSLSSGVVPRYPNCYNARITISVYVGYLMPEEIDYYREAGAQCPADPNEACNISCWTTCNNGICPQQQDIQECTPYCSPLLLDLGGNGITTSGADDPVWFDIDADGTADLIGWTARNANDAFLWRDTEPNHRVDDGSELFGVGMTLPNGHRAGNGFEALSAYDEILNGGNGDGLITSADAVWNRLRLWTDEDHDAASDPRELIPIQSSCVESLDLHWTPSEVVDASGNQLRMVSTYRCHASGDVETKTRLLADVFFHAFR